MSTLTRGLDVITPTLVLGYEARRASNAQVHPIIGSDEPDITDRPASLRSGTMEVLIESEADASEAVGWLAEGGVWTFADTDRTTLNADLVVVGDVEIALEDETRDLWVVGFGWQEVT